MFKWLKRKLMKIANVKEVVMLSSEDAKKLKAEEQARGIAEGIAAAAKEKQRKAEKEVRRAKDVNVNKYLSERAKEIRYEPYKGAFSWRKFFREVEKKNNFYVYSYNFAKKFGKFYDMSTLKDGRRAIWIENNGHIEPIITGRTDKDMFRNFSGLSYIATKGHIPINLDENYEYVENIEEKEVPSVMVDGNGNIVVSSIDSGPFIEKLAESQATIDRILQNYKTLERTFAEVVKENKLKEMYKNLGISRAESLEGSMKSQLESIHKLLADQHDLLVSSARVSNEKEIVEDRNKKIEQARDEIMKEFKEKFSETPSEEVERSLQRRIDWIINNVLFRTTKAAERLKESPKVQQLELPQEEGTKKIRLRRR